MTPYSQLNKWDKRFLNLANYISQWSKDPSTKCGAVISRGNRIISLGFNGFPMLIGDQESLYADREIKYKMILHAEINAILFAKEDLSGCTLYTTPFPPCARCAAQIIQKGIRKIVAPISSSELLDRWSHELVIAEGMYLEAGIELIEVHMDEEPTK